MKVRPAQLVTHRTGSQWPISLQMSCVNALPDSLRFKDNLCVNVSRLATCGVWGDLWGV